MNEFLSGALSGLITGWFAFGSTDKKNQLEHITTERRKWRDCMREIIPEFLYGKEDINGEFKEISNSKRKAILAAVKIRLNPFDENDIEIVSLMSDYIENQIPEIATKIEDAVARLLKHDWDRVRKETKMKSPFSLGNIALLLIYLLIIRSEIYTLFFETTMPQCTSTFDIYLCIIFKSLLFIIILTALRKIWKLIKNLIENQTRHNSVLNILFNLNYRK